jgi:chemotaxis protein methyltransferase CheR
LRDRVAGPFDLIACRNVVIYFTDEAKTKLYQSFVDALRPGGYLFIGATEVIGGAAQLGLRYVAPCFYVKDER